MLRARGGSLGALLIATLLYSPAISVAAEGPPECVLNGQTLIIYGTPEADTLEIVRLEGPPVKIAVLYGPDKQTACEFEFFDFDFDRIEVYGGDGDDIIVVDPDLKEFGDGALPGSGPPTLLDGGKGNDELRAGGGRTTLQGGEGDDKLYGSPKNDVFRGDPAPPEDEDEAALPPGNDTIRGGEGKDELQDEGAGGDDVDLGPQEDDLQEESILEGIDEVFVPASDDYRGGTGNDVLASAQDDDRLWGEQGDDVLSGGLGDSLLLGGPGDDRLIGGEGMERLEGGSGADVILSRDGNRDVISGGADRDRAVVDRMDIVRGVERVSKG